MSNTPEEAPPSEYMSVQSVATYTGLSADFWNKLRSVGGGPQFVKISAKAVRYRRGDVDAWMTDRLRASTFDDRKAAA